MIETESLILDKAKFSDWTEMYHNVWSQPESARYMEWTITTSEEAAKIRITKTIAFQKEHDTYLVYEKTSGKAIGFAGVEKIEPFIYQEAGICLGPNYVGKGFGRQILQGLIQYCREKFDAKEFIYSDTIMMKMLLPELLKNPESFQNLMQMAEIASKSKK